MNCIVSVAFREPYVTHSKRQQETIRELGFSGLMNFYRDMLPMKNRIHDEVDTLVSEFQKSLYGFKPHAIQRAIDLGYNKIIWFDPSVLPITPMQILFDALDEHPMIVRTGEHPILEMSNQKCKDYFGITPDNDFVFKHYKHIGGTIYGFNFNDPKTVECFNMWKKAEEDGIFGSQDEFMAGHWADEAVMVFCMYKCSIKQYFPQEFRYLNQKEL